MFMLREFIENGYLSSKQQSTIFLIICGCNNISTSPKDKGCSPQWPLKNILQNYLLEVLFRDLPICCNYQNMYILLYDIECIIFISIHCVESKHVILNMVEFVVYKGNISKEEWLWLCQSEDKMRIRYFRKNQEYTFKWVQVKLPQLQPKYLGLILSREYLIIGMH